MKNYPFVIKTALFRWAIALTAPIMLLGLSLSACASRPTPPSHAPTQTIPVSLSPESVRRPLTATPSPYQTPTVRAPDTVGSLQFLQYTYSLRRGDERDNCDSVSGICPAYLALFSDVYTWLYIHPGETYPIQFELNSGYQLKPIEPHQACQLTQDAQDSNLIAIMCAETGEYALQFDIQDTRQDVQYPLHLNLFSIPEQTGIVSALPPELSVEEYELIQHPESDTRSFIPVTGSAAGILAIHEWERGQPSEIRALAYLENGQELRAQVTADSPDESPPSEEWSEAYRFLVSIMQEGKEIFTTRAPVLTNDSFLGLWASENHWFIEVIRLAEDSFRALTRGEIFQDGRSLNELYGYTESFGFQLLHGKPFYFFERDGRIGIVYDGQEILLGYDRVLHNGCCSSGVLNPIKYENMVGFFAVRGAKWYYVEIGAFEAPYVTTPPVTLPPPSSTSIESSFRWTEYETALVKAILWEDGFCEWEILGQAAQEVYVWAVCRTISGGGGSVPAVIYLATGGTIEKVVIPGDGVAYGVDIQKLFPPDVQTLVNTPNQEFIDTAWDHLIERQKDPSIPPLIVLEGIPLP